MTNRSSLPARAVPAVLLLLGCLGQSSAAAAAGSVLPGPDEAPEITIVPREGDVIEEYRVNGRLYMIRVIPRRGVPYYLIDTDGDGNLETRRNELSQDLVIPGWTLFRW